MIVLVSKCPSLEAKNTQNDKQLPKWPSKLTTCLQQTALTVWAPQGPSNAPAAEVIALAEHSECSLCHAVGGLPEPHEEPTGNSCYLAGNTLLLQVSLQKLTLRTGRQEWEHLQQAQSHPGWCSRAITIVLGGPNFMEQKKQLRLANGNIKDVFSPVGREQIPHTLKTGKRSCFQRTRRTLI